MCYNYIKIFLKFSHSFYYCYMTVNRSANYTRHSRTMPELTTRARVTAYMAVGDENKYIDTGKVFFN